MIFHLSNSLQNNEVKTAQDILEQEGWEEEEAKFREGDPQTRVGSRTSGSIG